MTRASFDGTFQGWRSTARRLLAADIVPQDVLWTTGDVLSLGDEPPPPGSAGRVPKAFLDLAHTVAMHRDDRRWPLLYRVLYRLTHGEPELLELEVDDDVRSLHLMNREVRRDIHNMHAFVRFRQAGGDYIAWHRPDHYIVEAAAPFFVNRFGSMNWAILTPDRSAYWDQKQLRFGPGVPRLLTPGPDELEDLWRSYYRSVFNPARVNAKATLSGMPARHWGTLPEAQIIPDLLLSAPARVQEMTQAAPASAADFLPADRSLPSLCEAARACRGCPLYGPATQTVFGEGPRDARVVLVGEQPGDAEDRTGRPFVGPAGQLLDQALKEAGIDRSLVYVTNAVKHFKFTERGKRRIHQTPDPREVAACRPWLEAEIAAIQPRLLVALGATAGHALAGRAVRIGQERGRLNPHRWAESLLITTHPSALLRNPDPAAQAAQYELFVSDLKLIAGRC